MDAQISVETVAGKLNRVGYECFLKAIRLAKHDGNVNIELCHWILYLAQREASDFGIALDYFAIDRARLLDELGRAVAGLAKHRSEMPGFSEPVMGLLYHGWFYATLLFGETQITTSHLLVAASKEPSLRPHLLRCSSELAKISIDPIPDGLIERWRGSEESGARAMVGSGAAATSLRPGDFGAPQQLTPMRFGVLAIDGLPGADDAELARRLRSLIDEARSSPSPVLLYMTNTPTSSFQQANQSP